jgi:hypothetical protein
VNVLAIATRIYDVVKTLSLVKLVNLAAIGMGLLGNQFGAPLGAAPILLAACGAFNLIYPKISGQNA